jgi:hypothetical protein
VSDFVLDFVNDVPGRLVMADYHNPNPVLGPEGDVSDHITPHWRTYHVFPETLTEDGEQELALIASIERMECFHFYCAILPYLVLIGIHSWLPICSSWFCSFF